MPEPRRDPFKTEAGEGRLRPGGPRGRRGHGGWRSLPRRGVFHAEEASKSGGKCLREDELEWEPEVGVVEAGKEVGLKLDTLGPRSFEFCVPRACLLDSEFTMRTWSLVSQSKFTFDSGFRETDPPIC